MWRMPYLLVYTSYVGYLLLITVLCPAYSSVLNVGCLLLVTVSKTKSCGKHFIALALNQAYIRLTFRLTFDLTFRSHLRLSAG